MDGNNFGYGQFIPNAGVVQNGQQNVGGGVEVQGQPNGQMAQPFGQSAPATQQNNGGITQTGGTAQRFFTQGQLDAIVSGRVNDLNGRCKTLEGQNAQLQAQNAQLMQEIEGYKQRETLASYNINPNLYDFTSFEVDRRVKAGMSKEDAFKEVTATYPFVVNVQNVSGQASQVNPQLPNGNMGGSQGSANPVNNPSQNQQVNPNGMANVGGNTQFGNTQPNVQNNQPVGFTNNQNTQNFQGGTVQNQQVQQQGAMFTGGTGVTGQSGGITNETFDVKAFLEGRTKRK